MISKNVSIGKNSIINGSVIKQYKEWNKLYYQNSVLMEGVEVADNSIISYSIIEKTLTSDNVIF